MNLTMEKVGEQVGLYLSAQWNTAVSVDEVSRIFGGASRETYRMKIHGGGHSRGIIVRRDPPTSLIDTERALEYGAYASVFPTSIPVPEPLFLEEDPSWLGQPFSIMAEIEDGITDVTGLNDEQRQVIGNEKWSILGRLAALDPLAAGFAALTPVPALENCAAEQLAYWEKVILADEIHPQPIAAAAIRWLKRNLPAPAQKLAVVHGDFRTGNFLFHPERGILGILDWEMCHLGDPLEDLAWSMDPLWNWGNPELAGRLLPHQTAIKIWEAASGLKVNLKDFRWWRIFNSVKAIAIWISSSQDYHHGQSKDSILAMAGWIMTDRENRILLDQISPLSTQQFGVSA